LKKSRYCKQYERNIHFCALDEETLFYAEQDYCVARERPDSHELPAMYIGESNLAKIQESHLKTEALAWSKRENEIDETLKNIAFSTRKCNQCNYPAPNWRMSCKVCGNHIGKVNSENA
jgi:hypothetical protein